MTICLAVQEWLSARLDGETTSVAEAAAAEDHLKACGVCRRETDRLEALKGMVAQGLESAPVAHPPPWFASRVADRIRPVRRWPLVWPALAAAVAGLALAWFIVSRPSRQELMSVYELKPVEPAATAIARRNEPLPVEHYLEAHVREASSAPPVDSQGLIEYVGFHR